MQTNEAMTACRAIYHDTHLSAGAKLSAIGTLFGWSDAGSAVTTAARPRARAAPTPQRRARTPRATTGAKAQTAARQPTRARKQAANAPTLTERVYGLIPETGGIEQTKLKVAGYKPNLIGNTLARLQKAGRIVSQGPAGQRVWARAAAQQQAEAA